MENNSTQILKLFSQMHNPQEAFLLMRYHEKVQRIIDDTTLSSEEKVFNIISSQMFRSISFPEENRVYLKESINASYKEKSKLIFLLGFGAYKTHYSYSYPFPNFAEVLNIMYMKVLAYVLKKVYPFGVDIIYLPMFKEHVSEITAIPLKDLEKYQNTFEKMFYILVKPEESLSYMNNTQLYQKLHMSSDEVRQIILKRISSHVETIPDDIMISLIKNLHVAGLQPMSTPELLQQIRHKYLYHEYYVSLLYSKLLEVYPHAIAITPRKKVSRFLTSMKFFYNSVVQFWVGDGIFLQQGQDIFPTIASKNQIKSLHFVDYIPLGDEMLGEINSHLKHIPLYEYAE